MLSAMATGYEHLSEEELWESLRCSTRDADGIARTPELIGEFTVEEAVEMGAFFEDPAEEAAFERLVGERARARASAA